MRSVASVCVSVCLSEYTVGALIFEFLDLQTLFLVRSCVFIMSKFRSSFKVTGSGSRSCSVSKYTHLPVVCLPLKGNLVVADLNPRVKQSAVRTCLQHDHSLMHWVLDVRISPTVGHGPEVVTRRHGNKSGC